MSPKRCKVADVLSALDLEERRLLQLVLNEGTGKIGATKIANVLTDHGHKIGQTTIKAHRSGVCACHRN